MTGQYVLGIDNGGTVAKAALFELDGTELAVASGKTETLSPHAGWAEFDMDRLWQATADSIKRVIGSAGVSPQDIACVACCGHGNGIYLVDEKGRPVRNGVYSADTRAREYVERWSVDGTRDAVRPKTMQALWAAQPNALLAWLRDHEPDTYARSRWVLMCKDFIRLRLTGEAYAERTDMSGTSLLDVGSGQYDAELLEQFGIPEAQQKLPPLRLSTDICGQVTAAAAAQTGLAEGTPVAGGLFDVDACGLSSALLEESQLGMVFGTWGISQYISQTPANSDNVFMSTCYCVPGYYLMLDASPASAGNLEWFIRNFFGTESDGGDLGSQSAYDHANALVSGTTPDEANIVFLPFLYGSNVGPDASATLVGLHDRHDRGHILRAVYEGVVFAHKTHLDRLLTVREMPRCIRASGGATHSQEWMQIVADVFQVPVEIPDGTELGALGAAICAAVAVGCHADFPTACNAMVRLSRSFEPNPKWSELYESKYARYTRLLEALAPAWSALT